MPIQISNYFFTLTGAANELDVERHTVWRWIKVGKLEAQKAGGVVFIEKSAVEELKKRVAQKNRAT